MKIFRYYINSLTARIIQGLLSYCLCICLSYYYLALLYNHELTMHDYRIIVAGCCYTFCLSLIHLYLKDNAPHCKKDLIYNIFLLFVVAVAWKTFYLYFYAGLLLHFSSLSLCFGRWFFFCFFCCLLLPHENYYVSKICKK